MLAAKIAEEFLWKSRRMGMEAETVRPAGEADIDCNTRRKANRIARQDDRRTVNSLGFFFGRDVSAEFTRV